MKRTIKIGRKKVSIDELFERAGTYVKKPIGVQAVQIDEPFEVKTPEGTMRGAPGDYLIKGVKGKFYPCDMDIFRLTYEEVKE